MMNKGDLRIAERILCMTDKEFNAFLSRIQPSTREYLEVVLDKFEKERL